MGGWGVEGGGGVGVADVGGCCRVFFFGCSSSSLPSLLRSYLVLPGFGSAFFKVVPSLTGFLRALLSFTQFDWVWFFATKDLPSFTGFLRVLPSFTGLGSWFPSDYLVLLGF